MKSAGCQLETLRMLSLNLSKTAAITGGKEETVKLFCQAWAKNIDTERGYLDKVTKKQFSQNAIIMTYDISRGLSVKRAKNIIIRTCILC